MLKRVPIICLRVLTMMLLMLGVAMPAAADDIADCNQGDDLDLRIRACTSLIEAARLKGNDLAAAYALRGSAYMLSVDPDSFYADRERAIADFDKAIQLNPDYAGAYNDRSLLYELKGDYPRAIADCEKAHQLDPHSGCRRVELVD